MVILLLKVILYLDPAGAKTSVPVLPTLKPRKSLGVTFLTILYLSEGSVSSGNCVSNFFTLFIFFRMFVIVSSYFCKREK